VSLRTRLLAGMAFIAAALLVVSVLITVTTRDHLMDQVDERLRAFALSRPGPDQGSGGQPLPPPPQQDATSDVFPNRLGDVYQGVVGADGALLTWFAPNVGAGEIGPPDLQPGDLPTSGQVLVTVDAVGSDDTYRVLARRLDDRVEVTGVLIDDEQSTIQRLIVVEVLGVLAILTALGVVTWWMLRLGIRPVKEMTETATRIAEGDLSVRVPEQAPGTEPGELADALNSMLGRIETEVDARTASEERLRRFVADASHELRTPITTIRGYAELYRHGGLSAETDLADAMRRTEQEAARMGRLVDDMLVLAKLDQERPLETRPVDLGALALDAAADARAAAPGRDITVEIDASEAVVLGDEDRLRQVVGNVVGNALVHTDGDVPIAIRVQSSDGMVVLEVDDLGQGMTTEVAERVTERFFRADPARSRHRGGSGLGLAIVDAAVAAHGGSVDIDSEHGRGTTVRLTMPALDSAPTVPEGDDLP
jgi:two-component system OmpR family sensor kinase